MALHAISSFACLSLLPPQLEGECTEEDFSPVDWPQDDDAFVGRKRRTAGRRKEERRVKRQTVRRGESCDNTAVKGVRVKVVAKEELSVLPAQVSPLHHIGLLSTLSRRTPTTLTSTPWWFSQLGLMSLLTGHLSTVFFSQVTKGSHTKNNIF